MFLQKLEELGMGPLATLIGELEEEVVEVDRGTRNGMRREAFEVEGRFLELLPQVVELILALGVEEEVVEAVYEEMAQWGEAIRKFLSSWRATGWRERLAERRIYILLRWRAEALFLLQPPAQVVRRMGAWVVEHTQGLGWRDHDLWRERWGQAARKHMCALPVQWSVRKGEEDGEEVMLAVEESSGLVVKMAVAFYPKLPHELRYSLNEQWGVKVMREDWVDGLTHALNAELKGLAQRGWDVLGGEREMTREQKLAFWKVRLKKGISWEDAFYVELLKEVIDDSIVI